MTENIQARLKQARNLWIATVRPDGRPHLTPVWFVIEGEHLLICISTGSVKAGNLQANDRVACALEDGNSPVIFEGRGRTIEQPWPETALAAFKDKYDWELAADLDYGLLIELEPEKWLTWQ
ncbi:MAG TPA: pyridoxamine 5'-phosphate oxidase family protein [Anaerolineales bacterium]|nr:pyridoxamine 5'-phosphate oxidase family protein [Anaerolineales bacterium]